MLGGIVDRLEKAGIEFEIVPGVSAYNASCAILKKGMTGLGTTNTAICTTWRDRSDVEAYLDKIASLGASVALFMSVEQIQRICEIFQAHYPPQTAVAVISNASRPNQKVVLGDLQTINERIKEANVNDGLILIGEFLDKAYDYEVEKEFMKKVKEERRRREQDK
jgi:precorrin-4/cobalt-precorrin-4 C11-methyltransferase